jgi:hypothetical protein
MNIVISKSTNSVFKDGISFLNLDITIPEEINALYWNGSMGWIDSIDSAREQIEELPKWASNAIEVYEAKANPPAPVLSADQIRAKTIDEYKQAAQSQLDTIAQSWGYDSIISAASYANSTNGQFKSEALVLIAWRDEVWTSAYALLASVQSNKKSAPKDVDDFLAQLPASPSRPAA